MNREAKIVKRNNDLTLKRSNVTNERTFKRDKPSNFKTHLKNEGYKSRSIQNHEEYLVQFTQWLQSESLSVEEVTYSDLLGLIKQVSHPLASKHYPSRLLVTIRHYYQYLKTQGKTTNNPAQGFYLKNIPRRLPLSLIHI